MIQKVRHLLRFPDQELFEEHRLVLPRPEDEEADKALMRQLLSKAEGVEDAHKMDLFYWIDAHTKAVRHVVNNGALKHKEVCELVNIAGLNRGR